MGKILITSYTNPDIDGVAACLSYGQITKEKGLDVMVGFFGTPLPEVEFVANIVGVRVPIISTGEGNWDKFILIDNNSMKRAPTSVRPDDVIEVIDHHEPPEVSEFKNASVQNEQIGAVATLIVERYIKNDIEPTKENGILLYAAIHHNTLDLLSSNTNDRDRVAVDYLAKKFGLNHSLIEKMFAFSSQKTIEDIPKAIADDAKEFMDNDGERAIGYQLMVWELPDDIVGTVSETTAKLDSASGASWSFTNIICLKEKTSYLFANNKRSLARLSPIYGDFDSGDKIVFPGLLLRKQILSKIIKKESK